MGERRVEADKVEQALVAVGKVLKSHMLITEEQMIRAVMRLKRRFAVQAIQKQSGCF
jgi:hypothetical protein